MVETYPGCRIEVLVDMPLVPRIVAALDAAGVTGHSVIPALSGAGRGGTWTDERLTAAETKVIVMAITSPERGDRAVETLAPLLDSHRLLLTISDVRTVRAGRFD